MGQPKHEHMWAEHNDHKIRDGKWVWIHSKDCNKCGTHVELDVSEKRGERP